MPAIVTLTMNPALDVAAAAQAVIHTEKVRCHASRRDPGGGGINVARVIQRQGGKVQAVYPAGGLTGQALTDLIEQEGVPTKIIRIAGETREDFNILDEQAKRQYRFILPGPELGQAEWGACLAAVEKVGPGFACASGSLPPGVPEDFYARFAERARRAGQKAFLDTSGRPLKKALAAPLYLIKPNLKELGELVDDALSGEVAQLKACRAVLARSSLEAIALTLGADGAMLVTKQAAFRARPAPVPVVGTVGAGDSFMGVLIWALAAGMEPRDALRFAVAGGTAAVLTEGTGLCRPADVERLARLVAVSELDLAPA